MKKTQFIIFFLFLGATLQAQTILKCGSNQVVMTGEKLSFTRYIGSDKKSNSITNFYYQLGKDSLVVWEEAFNDEGTCESITITSIHRKDISKKDLPYHDVFPGSEYDKPVQRIYVKALTEEGFHSISWQSWTSPGSENHGTNGFYQIDGADKAVHAAFLEKLLKWLNN